jgi:hypothetical protein
VVERQLPKLNVVGSIPIARSKALTTPTYPCAGRQLNSCGSSESADDGPVTRQAGRRGIVLRGLLH